MLIWKHNFSFFPHVFRYLDKNNAAKSYQPLGVLIDLFKSATEEQIASILYL